MRKIFISLCMVFLCISAVKAQEPKYVSTEPSNRNVLIEELTGRNCPNCPKAQKVVNSILKDNPGRVFTVNYHYGGTTTFSPTDYPNLNTLKGATLMQPFFWGGLPATIINRTTDVSLPLYNNSTDWRDSTNLLLAQPAECNIAGQVVINPDTRLAKINVEVYYTADCGVENNYLNIIMLQDNIIGAQSGASYNPEQMTGNQYRHMHIYRNSITENWGEEIGPTTAETLIKKSFKYTIPEIIGDPNGVAVDLENVHFLAFVTKERYNNTIRTMPILNVCQLENVEYGTSVEDIDETSYNIYPNPANDIITISANDMKQILIHNSLGQVVKSVECNDSNVQINVSDLMNGMYFVNIIDKEGNTLTSKLTINN